MTEIKIHLGDKDLPIRPTPLAKLAPVFPALAKLDPQGGTGEGMAATAEALASAVFHGIRRAGGEVTEDWVKENIDFTNFHAVFETFARVNGLQPRAAGQGEAGAGAVS